MAPIEESRTPHAGPSRPRLLGRRSPGGLLALALVVALPGCTGDPPRAPSAAPSPTVPAGPLLERTALAGGTTEVVADRAFLEALDRLGLAPRATGAGRASGPGTFAFPVTGGELAVSAVGSPGGEVRHDGSGLLLTSGTSSLSLEDLVLDGDAGVVTATVSVDGAERAEDAPVLAVTAAGVEVPATGEPPGSVVVRGLRLALTAQGAEVLNEVHAPDGFAPGAPVGAVTLTLEPERP